MNKIKLWIKAARAPFLTASLISVILGAVIAWNMTGEIHWLKLILTACGVIFVHSGTNLVNDYFDHKSSLDEINVNHNMFSGGSRVIQDKELSPGAVLTAGLLCFAVTAVLGLYLNFVTAGNVILYIGLSGFLIGYFYTAKPLKLGYTSLGEIITVIACGPLIVYGTYFVLSQTHALQPMLASIPIGILVGLILYINEFQDFDADKAVGKKTLVVVFGKTKAIKIFYFFLVFNYIWVIFGVVLAWFPIYTLAVILTLPICAKAIKVAHKNYDKIEELLPANAATIGLHMMFGILFSLGFVLDKLL